MIFSKGAMAAAMAASTYFMGSGQQSLGSPGLCVPGVASSVSLPFAPAAFETKSYFNFLVASAKELGPNGTPAVNPYTILGVDVNSPASVVKEATAYAIHDAEHTLYPGLNKDAKRLKQTEELLVVKGAYDITSDELLRCLYHKQTGLPDWYGIPLRCVGEHALNQLRDWRAQLAGPEGQTPIFGKPRPQCLPVQSLVPENAHSDIETTRVIGAWSWKQEVVVNTPATETIPEVVPGSITSPTSEIPKAQASAFVSPSADHVVTEGTAFGATFPVDVAPEAATPKVDTTKIVTCRKANIPKSRSPSVAASEPITGGLGAPSYSFEADPHESPAVEAVVPVTGLGAPQEEALKVDTHKTSTLEAVTSPVVVIEVPNPEAAANITTSEDTISQETFSEAAASKIVVTEVATSEPPPSSAITAEAKVSKVETSEAVTSKVVAIPVATPKPSASSVISPEDAVPPADTSGVLTSKAIAVEVATSEATPQATPESAIASEEVSKANASEDVTSKTVAIVEVATPGITLEVAPETTLEAVMASTYDAPKADASEILTSKVVVVAIPGGTAESTVPEAMVAQDDATSKVAVIAIPGVATSSIVSEDLVSQGIASETAISTVEVTATLEATTESTVGSGDDVSTTDALVVATSEFITPGIITFKAEVSGTDTSNVSSPKAGVSHVTVTEAGLSTAVSSDTTFEAPVCESPAASTIAPQGVVTADASETDIPVAATSEAVTPRVGSSEYGLGAILSKVLASITSQVRKASQAGNSTVTTVSEPARSISSQTVSGLTSSTTLDVQQSPVQDTLDTATTNHISGLNDSVTSTTASTEQGAGQAVNFQASSDNAGTVSQTESTGTSSEDQTESQTQSPSQSATVNTERNLAHDTTLEGMSSIGFHPKPADATASTTLGSRRISDMDTTAVQPRLEKMSILSQPAVSDTTPMASSTSRVPIGDRKCDCCHLCHFPL